MDDATREALKPSLDAIDAMAPNGVKELSAREKRLMGKAMALTLLNVLPDNWTAAPDPKYQATRIIVRRVKKGKSS